MAANVTYRSDALRALTALTPRAYRGCAAYKSVQRFVVEPFGNFPVPAGLVPGSYADCHSDDLADALAAPFKLEPNPAFGALLARFAGARWGLAGVYHFVDMVRNRYAARPAPRWAGHDYADGLLKLLLDSAQHSTGDIPLRAVRAAELRTKHWGPAQHVARSLVRIVTNEYTRARRNAKLVARAEEEPLSPGPPIIDGPLRGFKCLGVNRLSIIWEGDEEFGGTIPYIFTRVQIDLVRDLLLGAANVEQEAGVRLDGGEDHYKRLCAELKWMFASGAKLAAPDAPLLAGALDTGHFALLAQWGNELDDRPMIALRAKYAKKGFHRVIALDALLDRWQATNKQHKLDFSYLYRMLPAGDYDQFGAAFRQSTQCFNEAEFTHPPCSGVHWAGILQYHKYLQLFAFYELHGQMPGRLLDVPAPNDTSWRARYPNVSPSELSYRDMGLIDFNGDFVYRARGVDGIDLVADTGMCPAAHATLTSAEDRSKLPVSERNKLMGYIQDPRAIDTETLRWAEVGKGIEQDDKAESKKIDQRAFFKAQLEAALLLSELEDSIGTYGVRAPGVVNGLDQVERHRELNYVNEPAPPSDAYTAVTWSFDIAGFSRNFWWRVHESIDLQWADAFGRPDIANTHKVLLEGDVLYVKPGVCHRYAKTGVDYEGMFGKRNTMYHAAVMGYVVAQLRARSLINKDLVGVARFACFIDDGCLRLILPTAGLKAAVRAISDLIEEIYEAGSMRISWDKTLVSQHVATFLGDVRCEGKAMPCGTKAIARVSNSVEAAVDNLTEDLDAAVGTIGGAIKAGTHLVPACAVFVNFVADSVIKWGALGPNDVLKGAHALEAFFPRSLGGLGLPGALQLAGSVGAQLLVESIGILKRLAFRNDALAPYINARLKGAMRTASLSDAVKAAGGTMVRCDREVLRGDRLAIRLKDALPRIVRNPAIVEALSRAENPAEGFVAAQLHFGAILPLVIRQKGYALEPAAFRDRLIGKFLRTRTAAAALPRGQLNRVANANRVGARRVIAAQRRG